MGIAGHIDRNAWIAHRKRNGWDFALLVEKLATLVVAPVADGSLLVDSSALAQSSTAVTKWPLRPDTDTPGFWTHAPSGESGPLFEILVVIAETTAPGDILRRKEAP